MNVSIISNVHKKSVSKVPVKELKELEAALPYGAKKRIGEKTGLSRSSINDVFKGKFHNEDVISEACTEVKEAHRATTLTRKKIADSLNQIK